MAPINDISPISCLFYLLCITSTPISWNIVVFIFKSRCGKLSTVDDFHQTMGRVSDPAEIFPAELFADILRYAYSVSWERESNHVEPMLLVSRSWFDHAVSVAWSRVRSSCFYTLPKSRLQFYADHVRMLYINEIYDDTIHLRKFPKLRTLQVVRSLLPDRERIRRAEAEPLRDAERLKCLYDDTERETILRGVITMHASQIKHLRFMNKDGPINMNKIEFQKLIQSCHALTELTALYKWSDALNIDTLIYLASNEKLEALGLGDIFTPDKVRAIHSRVPRPFENLHRLFMHWSKRTLFPWVSVRDLRLTTLYLQIKTDHSHTAPFRSEMDYTPLAEIAEMTTLRQLDIWFWPTLCDEGAAEVILPILDQMYELPHLERFKANVLRRDDKHYIE